MLTPSIQVHANLESVTALAVDAEGSIWAGTSGGLVQWTPDGRPRLWTRADGLPGLRIRRLQAGKDGLVVVADDAAKLVKGRFVAASATAQLPAWSERDTVGLPGKPIARVRLGNDWIWAVPESGVYALRNGKAIPIEPLPPTRLVTALTASTRGDLLIGTADQGVWRRSGQIWAPLPLPTSSLKGPDATSLIRLGNQLWISPREGPAFRLAAAPAPVAGAPWRTAVRWAGKNLVRWADGKLVVVDEQGHEKPSGLVLPRVNANAIAVSGATLFVAQPGGWSEFTPDGPPVHRFSIDVLKGAPTTCIWADETRVAIGTQDRGLIVYDRTTGDTQFIHETHGLTDDWITAIAPDGDRGLLIGTFVGGLLRVQGGRAEVVGLPGGCITRLLPDGERIWVGSLESIREWSGSKLSKPAWADRIEPDLTDIAVHNGRLWIAAGGSLFEVWPSAP